MPDIEPGILFVERQFGVLEVHGSSLADVMAAGQAILDGLGAEPTQQLAPRVLYHDVIEKVTDTHAVIMTSATGVEDCAVCHGPDEVFSANKFHALLP